MRTVLSSTLLVIALLLAATPSLAQRRNAMFPGGESRPDVTLSLRVANVAEALDRVEAQIDAVGGKISRRTKNQTSNVQDGAIQATIPAAKVDGLLRNLRRLGEVNQESSNSNSQEKEQIVSIAVTDRIADYASQGSRVSVFAGVTGAVLKVSGLSGDGKQRSGGGVTIAGRRYWAQFTLLVLSDPDKAEDSTNSGSEPAAEKESPFGVIDGLCQPLFLFERARRR